MFNRRDAGWAALGAVAVGGYLRVIRPWQLRWGATDAAVARPLPGADHVARPSFNVPRTIRAAANTAIFFLKVYPMLPSRPLNWVTPRPRVEKVRYPARLGGSLEEVIGDLYRPSGGGQHPGVVVCLGVVPFGVDHPQVPRLGEALARSGFAALLYWSPAMRDFRLDPADIGNIALAYEWLLAQPYVDPARSGLIGTCVGGSFALMAAATARIQHCVSFVFAYAPYSSMWTLARDIASASHSAVAAPLDRRDGCASPGRWIP